MVKYAANFPSDEVYPHRIMQYSTVRPPSLLAKYNISDMEKYNIEEDRKQLAEDILKMLERGSLNDVKIKLSDGEIVANKDILIARSDYFATMFSNNRFIEGETGSVDMRHSSKAVMEKIIKFLFGGAVIFDDLSLAQLLELSRLSGMLLLWTFQGRVDGYLQCEKIPDSGRNVENLPDLTSALKYADDNNLHDIEFWITEELHCGLKAILSDAESCDSFKTLPFNLIREIFLFDSLLTNRLPTTKQKLDCFMIWLSENEITEELKEKMVESFEFDDFTVEELMTTVRKSGLYSNITIDERVLELFKEQGDRLKEQDKLLNVAANI